MKGSLKTLPLSIFILLCLSAVLAGYDSYNDTKRMVHHDLHQALEKTVAERGFVVMKQDSIRAYHVLAKKNEEQVTIAVNDRIFQNHLSMSELKKKAYIAYTITNDKGKIDVRFRGQVDCSAMMFFSLSDQRLSSLFGMMALLWLVLSFFFTKRNRDARYMMTSPSAVLTAQQTTEAKGLGGIWFDSIRQVFMTKENVRLHLTPMQQQLLEMFFTSSSYRLTIQEICDALWPKKEDAGETLYTMIRRLRKVLQTHSSLKIESDRGRAYELRDDCQ